MAIKGGRSNFWFTAAMVVFVVLVLKYQDTDLFQSCMKFLFNPDNSIALPPFWQEYRLLIMGLLFLALLVYYRPLYGSCRDLVALYKNSPADDLRPELSVIEAAWLYRRSKAQCLVAWIIEHCSRGALLLEYRKGMNPWYLRRGPTPPVEAVDQQRIEALFQNGESLRLYAPLSEPEPQVQQLADQLAGEIWSADTLEITKRPSSLPAWLIFLVMLAEIPFFMASQSHAMPATLVVTLFSAALCGLIAYVVCDQFPVFFSESRVLAWIKLAVVGLFAFFGHWIMLHGGTSISWSATMLFPDLVSVLIVIVYRLPPLPKNTEVLRRIIGYTKFLSAESHMIREEELPWSLGLGLYGDLIEAHFYYEATSLPAWLHNETGEELQALMSLLHQTLAQQVNIAVYGEMDSKSRLSTGDKGWHH